MDRLILLRHGDAENQAPSRDDFDRGLTRRGEAESRATGETLAHMGLLPDLVLVSAAVRAQGTWAEVRPSFPQAVSRTEPDLYLAEDHVIRDFAESAGRTARTVMIVGHNPGIQELAVGLLMEGHADPSLIRKIQGGFPTATAAVFLIDAHGRPTYDGYFIPGI